jgi:hypothetical protein
MPALPPSPPPFLAPQLGKLVALYFVVAFGSSMDIAAIQADSPRDLDYNSELVTVGLSNLLTAGAGVGFTGARWAAAWPACRLAQQHQQHLSASVCLHPAPSVCWPAAVPPSQQQRCTHRKVPALIAAGSYIFSQTLFSLRMGVDSPLMGAIVAGQCGVMHMHMHCT